MNQQSFVQVSFDEKTDAEVYKIVDGNPFIRLDGKKAQLSEDGIKCSLDKSVVRDPIMPVNCRQPVINKNRNSFFFNFGFCKTSLKGSVKPANGSNSNIQEEVWPNQYSFYCWFMGENKASYNKYYALDFSRNAVEHINQDPNLKFADVMKKTIETLKPKLFRGLHICCFNNMFAIFNVGEPMGNFKVAILANNGVEYSFEVPEIRMDDIFKLFEVRKPKQGPKTPKGLVVYRSDKNIEEPIKQHIINSCFHERNVSQIFHNTDSNRNMLLYFFIPFRSGSWRSGDKCQKKKKKFYESIKEGPLTVSIEKIISNSKDQEILYHRKSGFCRLFLEKKRDQQTLTVYEPVEVLGYCNDYCEMIHDSRPSAVFFHEENGLNIIFHRHLIQKTFVEEAPDVHIDFVYSDQKERTFRSFIETFPSRILYNYKLFDIMDNGVSSSFFALNGCSHAFRRKMEERRGYNHDDGQCDILFVRKVIPCLFLEVPSEKDPEEISLYLNKLIVGCVFIIGVKDNFRKLNVYLQGGSTIYGYDFEGSVVHIFIQSVQKNIEIKTFILPLPRNEHKDKENHVEELPKNSDFKNNLQEYIVKYRNNTELDKKIYENEFADLYYHFVTDAYEFAIQNRFHEKSLLFFLMAYFSNKEWYKEWIRNKYLNLKEMGTNN
jgi:hypothetical protein